MADSITDQGAYPLVAHNFRVTVGGSTDLSVAEVSGLVQSYETLKYRHGLSFSEGEQMIRFAVEDSYSEMTLKKGITTDVSYLYEWLTDGEPRGLKVSLCDANGNETVSWETTKAIPIKIEGPSLQANSNEVAIDTITLMVARISVVKQDTMYL